MELIGYMQRNNVQSLGRISTSVIKDTLENLKSDNLCGLPQQSYQMPCWLPDGKSGTDYMAFRNGILNLKDIIVGKEPELIPCTSAFFSDKRVDYDYDPNAECPMWLDYINTTFDDPELREAMQNIFWYILTGAKEFNVGFFFRGDGGDGKTTAVHVLRYIVGENNVCCIPFSDLGKQFYTYELTTHTLNLVEELTVSDDQGNIGEAEKTFKIATDKGVLSVERKFQDISAGRARANFVFCTNGLPAFTDRSNGLWDRIVIIPFLHRFRGTADEKDGLKQEIAAQELSGVFNWAMQATSRLMPLKRFPVPAISKQFCDTYRLSCDHEAAFLKENVIVKEGYCLIKSKLYEAYSQYMKCSGYRPVGMAKFNAAVKRVFPDTYEERIRKPKDIWVWQNLDFTGTTCFSFDEQLRVIVQQEPRQKVET